MPKMCTKRTNPNRLPSGVARVLRLSAQWACVTNHAALDDRKGPCSDLTWRELNAGGISRLKKVPSGSPRACCNVQLYRTSARGSRGGNPGTRGSGGERLFVRFALAIARDHLTRRFASHALARVRVVAAWQPLDNAETTEGRCQKCAQNGRTQVVCPVVSRELSDCLRNEPV